MQSTTFGRLCIKHRIDLRKTYPCPKKGEHYSQYNFKHGENVTDYVQRVLDELAHSIDESGFLTTTSLFKLSTGSNKLRPYFKQFDSNGIFPKIIRNILLPSSSYKISLYKNDEGEYAAFWLLGFDALSDFEACCNNPIDKGFDIKKYSLDYCEECAQTLEENFNFILTGAPGTGKTFLAKQIAAYLVGGCQYDDLTPAQKKRVGFVQFHPSYDYTDFVEGLRPDESTGSFKLTNGIFKDFCKDALKCQTDKDELFNILYDELLNDLRKGKWTCETDGKYLAASENGIKVLSKTEDSSERTKHGFSKELIKRHFTYFATHPDEFESKSGKGGLKEINGAEIDRYAVPVIKELYSRSVAYSPKFVFIIDEINRGELSKIFGELFFSIDPGYRGERGKVQTQYNKMIKPGDVFKDGFFVPENVYIIGTMNDIDRGVEAMDFAIRRRFAWREVTAKESADNMGLSDLAKKKMTALNEALKSKGLNQAYYIGGAYFRKLKGTDFDSLWKYHLKGIVSEYFRGEPEADKKVEEVGEAYTAATIEVSAEQPTLNPSTEQQSE